MGVSKEGVPKNSSEAAWRGAAAPGAATGSGGGAMKRSSGRASAKRSSSGGDTAITRMQQGSDGAAGINKLHTAQLAAHLSVGATWV